MQSVDEGQVCLSSSTRHLSSPAVGKVRSSGTLEEADIF
jgi:hypothetical protein